MVTPSGKEVEIIRSISAKWMTVGVHFNFDRYGHMISLIDVHYPSDPEACCAEMMEKWVGGKGRQPANWATLVEVLRNAEFITLADEVKQLVPMPTEIEGKEKVGKTVEKVRDHSIKKTEGTTIKGKICYSTLSPIQMVITPMALYALASVCQFCRAVLYI